MRWKGEKQGEQVRELEHYYYDYHYYPPIPPSRLAKDHRAQYANLGKSPSTTPWQHSSER